MRATWLGKGPVAAGVAMAALLLGGCHRSSDADAPANQQDAPIGQMQAPEPAAPPPPVENAAGETPSAARPEVKPAPKLSADEQILEDAAATGMTARADRDETNAAAPGGNNSEQ